MDMSQTLFDGATCTITKMLMFETGRYHMLYNRPYSTEFRSEEVDTLTARLQQTPAAKISSGLVGDIATSIVAPSATPEAPIHIPNGWEERRIRFILEVEYELNLGTKGAYYIQGFTDRPGVNPITGSVDPQMEFIINSVTVVTRNVVLTPMGQQIIERITDSFQIFPDAQGNVYMQSGPTLYGLRPMDIYAGIHVNFLLQGQQYGGGGLQVHDYRTQLGHRGATNTRANNVPSQYLSRVINSYLTARELEQFGQASEEIVLTAAQNAHEPLAMENPFLRQLSRVTGRGVNRFRWPDLQKLRPDIDQISHYGALGEVSKQMPYGAHDPGFSAPWTGADLLTHRASIIANAVPALMTEHLVQKIHFRSTNHDPSAGIVTIILNARSMINADISRLLERFKERLELEVLRPISFNNQEAFVLDVYADLFGETWIDISIGAESMTRFVVPSFCDSLYTPIATIDKTRQQRLAGDFNELTQHISEELRPLTTPTPGIRYDL